MRYFQATAGRHRETLQHRSSVYHLTRACCAARYRCGIRPVLFLASTGGYGDHAGAAGDFDVVAPGSRFVARALQPHVVAHIAEGLIVEDKLGGPALEVDSPWSGTCGREQSTTATPYGR